MGTIAQVVEQVGEHYEIVELGGSVHHSMEMCAYLARLPKEEANRIVADLEYENRRRVIIRLRADSILRGSPEMDRILER